MIDCKGIKYRSSILNWRQVIKVKHLITCCFLLVHTCFHISLDRYHDSHLNHCIVSLFNNCPDVIHCHLVFWIQCRHKLLKVHCSEVASLKFYYHDKTNDDWCHWEEPKTHIAILHCIKGRASIPRQFKLVCVLHEIRQSKCISALCVNEVVCFH